MVAAYQSHSSSFLMPNVVANVGQEHFRWLHHIHCHLHRCAAVSLKRYKVDKYEVMCMLCTGWTKLKYPCGKF